MAKAKTPKVESKNHVVTEQDLLDHPEWKDQGAKVGDTVEIPADESTVESANKPEEPAPVEPKKEPKKTQPKKEPAPKSDSLVMLKNVLHNGIYLKEGEFIGREHPAAAAMLEQEYARTVELQ